MALGAHDISIHEIKRGTYRTCHTAEETVKKSLELLFSAGAIF
ncbi:hypothetical protein VRK_33300 [Vibrio sp. MEBiC08052]|nr:hypothetical protein VRK_33300 [Vibrio sp. MEBiC08052]